MIAIYCYCHFGRHTLRLEAADETAARRDASTKALDITLVSCSRRLHRPAQGLSSLSNARPIETQIRGTHD
eukprot:3114606-Pyramimonas_sp.AAC.1